MGVRAIVVSEKIQHNMRVYFWARDQTAFGYSAVVESRPTTSPPTRLPFPLRWFPPQQRCCFPSIPVITE